MTENKNDTSILIVDDKPENLRLLSGILKEQRYEVRLLRKGNMVMSSVLNSPPDLILLDIMMPETDGYEVCRQLKADERTCNIPVIFISALNEVVDKVKAFSVGGVDYIGKPFHSEEVLARVRTHLTISHLQQQVTARNVQLQKEIAERRQTEEKLVNANIFLDKIINAMPNPVFVKDGQHRWLILNDAFCDFMGYSREQLIGKSDCDFFPKEQADVFWEKDNLVFESKTVHTNEESFTDSDGKLNTILTKKSAMTDINGQKILVGIITDITERKNMEDALLESEEKYRNLVENINDAVYLLDNKGNILYMSPIVEKIAGYTPEELIGNSFAKYIYPEDLPSLSGRFREVLEGKAIVSEYRIYHKSGKIFWARTSSHPSIVDGVIVGAQGLLTDITERKRSEQYLEQNEARLESLLRISQYKVETQKDLLDYALSEAIRLTDSKIGYIYYYDENSKEFTLNSWSEDVMKECHITTPKTLYHLDNTGAWGEAVRQRRPIILNNFQAPHPLKRGYPEGHAVLYKFLTVPVFIEGKIVALIGVANKSSDYDESDARQLTLFMDSIWNIADRKRAENALKRSNSVLKAQQEASIDGIVTVDENKRVINYNQRFIELWNIPDDIVRSKDDKELLKSMLSGLKAPDIFLNKVRYLYENILDIGQDEIETTDGRTCDWYCGPIMSSENQYLGKIWFFRDITDRKRTEQALLEGEEKYRNLVENINDVVYILDPKGFFTYVSPVVESVTGFSPEEVVGKNMSDFIYYEDLPILYDQFKRLLSGKKAPILEYRFLKKSGEISWGRTSNRPKFKDGAVESIHGTFTDITERKRVEESLQRSEALLRDTGRMAKIGGWEFYVETQKLNWTEEVFKIHEVDFDYEPTVSKAIDFYVPESRPIIEQAVQRTIESGEPYDSELRFITAKGNHLWVHSIGKAFQQNGKTIRIFGTFQDITDRKLAEENLLKAKEAAETANRFKSDFLSNMSHEIRTPMNAILGFTELLASLIEDGQQKSYLEAIQSGGKSLLTLINDILDLSKIEAGKLDIRYEPINPHDIFNEVRQIFAIKMSEKHLDFITDISPDIPESLMLDEVRLRQILFNLIGNAVKFTESGYVKISAKCKMQNAKCDLVITVEDTGIGVPPESQDRIFEAFMQQEGQSAKKYGGTGLGLAITKRLVEMMKGEIVLESEPGRGSIFRITLHNVEVVSQKAVSKSHDDKPAEVSPENFIFEPATVLVADDMQFNRFLIKAIFDNTDISVIEAEDGRQAVCAAKEHLPDLILMDIGMPVMDGYEATTQIKQSATLKHIPVIALTAKAMAQDKEHILSAGFDGYIAKPVKRAELFFELSRFIKSNAKCKVQSAKNNEEFLCPETLKKLPEITGRLENEFAPLYNKAIESGNFSDIEEFANRIMAFGVQYSLASFAALGKNLLLHVRNFDIDHIEIVLNSYPKLVENI